MTAEISESNFKGEVLDSDKTVLVDFWAPWCGPCRMVSPVVEVISKEYNNTLKVVKVNVDNNPGLASKYDVQSIPTLKFFKNGDVVDTIVGFRSKSALEKTVEKFV